MHEDKAFLNNLQEHKIICERAQIYKITLLLSPTHNPNLR